ncbi:MAG: RNA 2',3'-cyclic phosphodiesterase [Rhodovarius sp.]|nr:RNA 2',3'-cyclic phosphodiesterase [Rhodovarius sp.]
MSLRLFVALPLPDALRHELAALASGIPGARWVPEENYHLTLRFIGEVGHDRAHDVDEALASVRAKPFDLTLSGVGIFERQGRVASLWVGAERSEGLTRLQAKVEGALCRIGLPPERRRFAPHVTLARTEGADPAKVAAFVMRHNLYRAAPVRVESFTLFSSHLGRDCASYTAEVEYALAA